MVFPAPIAWAPGYGGTPAHTGLTSPFDALRSGDRHFSGLRDVRHPWWLAKHHVGGALAPSDAYTARRYHS